MRFIAVDEQPVGLIELERALTPADPRFAIEPDETGATIYYGEARVAELDFNVPGDGLFEQELDYLRRDVLATDGGTARERVLATLDTARMIVAAQVLRGAYDEHEAPTRLDPLWQWLFANRKGLLQADGEGYYDGLGLVLRTGR
jgi:hypothetical protein